VTDRDRDPRQDRQENELRPTPSAETAGDPDATDVESGAHEGAAAGALIGAAVAGPIGLAAGVLIGGAAGATGEAADRDADRGYERRDEGTGPIDPIYEEKK
jgi:hypothetical protein